MIYDETTYNIISNILLYISNCTLYLTFNRYNFIEIIYSNYKYCIPCDIIYHILLYIKIFIGIYKYLNMHISNCTLKYFS